MRSRWNDSVFIGGGVRDHRTVRVTGTIGQYECEGP